MAIFVFLFVISTVSAEEISNETISFDSSLMTDSVSEYDLSISLSDKEIQGHADNGTFTDLQKKINNADAGSIITLENDYKYNSGFPTEGISINKTLTIDGNGHIIDALGQSRIFFINSTKVTLNNILFKNGNVTDNGGAIYWYGANGTINNCNFTNNIATQRAGAIYWSGLNGTINNSNFINNTARKYSGGAIQWDYNSTNGTINNCNFINNIGTQRGGAIYWYEVNGRMTNCNFTNNTSINGGAIFWDNNALNGVVENSSFINNTGNDGGAIYWYGAHGRMTNCNFTNNRGDNGGAINWQRTYGLINNCNFTNNIATNGGAIYWEGTNGTENNCTFTYNIAESNGGAIYWFGANGTISDSNFINNNATTNGGAICFNDAASLNYCALVNNIAPAGSEIYIYGGNPNLNYNWWGSNNPDWAKLIDGVEPSSYAVLNVTTDTKTMIPGSKARLNYAFYRNGTTEILSIPERAITLSATGGQLDDTSGYLVNGGFTTEFSADTMGTYEITAIVDNQKVNIGVIVGYPTEINITNETVDLKVGGEVSTGATLTPPDAGNLTYVSSNESVVKVENDMIKAIGVGSANVTVAFYGNEKYAPAESKIITVTVSAVKINTIISSADVVGVYNKTGKLVATLTDANGKAISGAKIKIELGNLTETLTTDDNGQVSLSLNGVIPDVYTAIITFDGDDVHDKSSATAKITITKLQSKVYLRNALYFTLETKMVKVTLWDANNKPVAGKTVHITLNEYNLTYSGVTDENGTATIRVGVGFGVHSVTVSFDGDEIYDASNRTGGVRVIKETPSIMVRGANTHFKASTNPKIVKVYLWDRNSKPLPVNSKVAIKINGHTFVGYTDSQGIASIKINVNKQGIFNAQVTYAGNSAYNAVTRSVKFTIS